MALDMRGDVMKKVLVGILLILSLLLASCYPELSVQQYDELREELAVMDIERNELKERLVAMDKERGELVMDLAVIEVKNAETLNYVQFLGEVLSVQSPQMILSGEFDVAAVVAHKDELIIAADKLEDSEIVYYLGLMNPDDESQSIGAYYKVIEYCLKTMRRNLE